MKTLSILSLCGVLLSPALLGAETVVIVHPSNAAALSKEDVSRIFLGKMPSFPGGGQAVALNLKEGNPQRQSFEAGYLDKTAAQLKAYWSQMVFTGKGTPPKEVDSEEEMKQLVATNPNLIGYIDASKVDASVKAVK